MPCDSSYLEPTERERELHRAAKLLLYVKNSLNIKASKSLIEQAQDCYGQDANGHDANDAVPELCRLIKSMSHPQREIIIYNARNKDARALADWWEEHEKADRTREREEDSKKRDAVIRKQAITKLSKVERKVLGV